MNHPGRTAAALGLVTALTLFALAESRQPGRPVWGDEGTFLAMAGSLAADGDLRFDERDLGRLQGVEAGRGALILQRSEAGIAYSKPILYPLATAPFFAAFGDFGLVLVNALALALALALAYLYLRRQASPGAALLLLATFTGASTLLPYVFWRMSDMLQVSFALAGLALALGWMRPAEEGAPGSFFDRPWVPYVGMAILGLLVSMRLTHAALAAIPLLACLLAKKWRPALGLGAVAGLSLLGVVGLNFLLIGEPLSYKAQRTTFNQQTGYPAGEGAETALARFEQNPATFVHRTDNDGRRRIYSAGYFLLGRHSGLLLYFPAAILFFLLALRRPDPVGLACLAGLGVQCAYLLYSLPWNYFGGDTFLGNRYFLPVYPAVLLALRRLPRGRPLALAWGLAAVAAGSALMAGLRPQNRDFSSQRHAHAGIFRLLPYESTAIQIASSFDRYWGHHLVRFVDPYVDIGKHHFELRSDRPAAELLVAHWQPLSHVRVMARTDAPHATLRFTDYRHREEHAIGTEDGPLRPIDLPLAPAWRRHRYWWDTDTLYDTHSLRLSLHTPDGSPATAQLFYLGDPQQNEAAFLYELLEASLPTAGTAGGRAVGRLRIRNVSPVIWLADDPVHLFVSSRLYRTASAGAPELVHEGPRLPVTQRVIPYAEATFELPIDWPEAPGDYLLEVDAALNHVGWFADHLGKPLARQPVQITAAAAPYSAPAGG